MFPIVSQRAATASEAAGQPQKEGYNFPLRKAYAEPKSGHVSQWSAELISCNMFS
ncbi:hypothetical protein NQZ68_016015 [Dissostichus eleginoides]|nr:hypothetical protein NQZ68_016015 [Dissostichus eleginoides]